LEIFYLYDLFNNYRRYYSSNLWIFYDTNFYCIISVRIIYHDLYSI